jgi:hypothetical protein
MGMSSKSYHDPSLTQQRIDPVGWDKEGNTYYLFDGMCLPPLQT